LSLSHRHPSLPTSAHIRGRAGVAATRPRCSPNTVSSPQLFKPSPTASLITIGLLHLPEPLPASPLSSRNRLLSNGHHGCRRSSLKFELPQAPPLLILPPREPPRSGDPPSPFNSHSGAPWRWAQPHHSRCLPRRMPRSPQDPLQPRPTWMGSPWFAGHSGRLGTASGGPCHPPSSSKPAPASAKREVMRLKTTWPLASGPHPSVSRIDLAGPLTCLSEGMITHKYRGSQQFLRVEYSTQIYRFDTRGAKEYL
jgi:hypothetical protein